MSEIKLLKGSYLVFMALSVIILLSVNVPRVKAPDITSYIVTLRSCDSIETAQTVFDQVEIVYVCGDGYDPNEGMIIRVIPNDHPMIASSSIRNVTATASGSGHLFIALGTFAPGEYDIWADRNKDGWLNMGLPKPEPAAGCGSCYRGFLVVPEYLFGTILGLAGFFGAFGVFRISKHRRK